MITAKLGRQRQEPDGRWASRIIIEDTEGPGRVITVLDKEKLVEADYVKTGRFDKLISNYQDDIEEQAKELQYPSQLSRTEVEALLKEKGLIDEGEHLEDVKSAIELAARE